MIRTNAVSILHLIKVVSPIGRGYGDWSFGPTVIAPTENSTIVASIKTDDILSRRNHAVANPCDHRSWEGSVLFNTPNMQFSETATWLPPFGTVKEVEIEGFGRGIYANYGEMFSLYRHSQEGDAFDYAKWDKGRIHTIVSVSESECLFHVGSCNVGWDGTKWESFSREHWKVLRKEASQIIFTSYIYSGNINYSVESDQYEQVKFLDGISTRVAEVRVVDTGLRLNDVESLRGLISTKFSIWSNPPSWMGGKRFPSPTLDPDEAYWRGCATQDAANAFNAVDSNVLANLLELPELGHTVPDIVKSLADDPNIKGLANAHLAYRFGDRLSYADAKQFLGSLNEQLAVLNPNLIRKGKGRNTHSWVDSQGRTRTISYASTIFIKNGANGVSATLERLDELGSLPDFENLWDIVPFSFAVDWFVDVSAAAAEIDTYMKIGRMNIIRVIESCKATMTVPASELVPSAVEGAILLKVYKRDIKGSPTMPVLDLDHLISTPSTINIVDGASLIISSS